VSKECCAIITILWKLIPSVNPANPLNPVNPVQRMLCNYHYSVETNSFQDNPVNPLNPVNRVRYGLLYKDYFERDFLSFTYPPHNAAKCKSARLRLGFLLEFYFYKLPLLEERAGERSFLYRYNLFLITKIITVIQTPDRSPQICLPFDKHRTTSGKLRIAAQLFNIDELAG
jgi:hypothetical protein